MLAEPCRTKWCVLVSAVLSACAAQAQDTDEVIAGAATTLNYPVFYDCFDGPSAGLAPGCATANFRPDGHVDLHDFAILQRSYQTLATTAIQTGGEMVGEISAIGDTDVFTFFAAQGAFITVDYYTPIAAGSYPDHFARLDLIRPDGTSANSSPGCGNFRLDNIAVNQTGSWTVRVRTHETWFNCGYGFIPALTTGAYRLTVCPTTNCPP